MSNVLRTRSADPVFGSHIVNYLKYKEFIRSYWAPKNRRRKTCFGDCRIFCRPSNDSVRHELRLAWARHRLALQPFP